MSLTILIIALHSKYIHTFGVGIFVSVEADALFVVVLVDFCSGTLVARAVSVSATCGCCLEGIGCSVPLGCCSLALVVAAVGKGFGNSVAIF